MRKLVVTLFCIALLIPSRGNTLGLGEIELYSSLNEELKAEIALTSVGQESADTIIVKLASRKEFARAGLDRPFILNDLKFKVTIKDGQPIIEVTSKKAIREPFLSFLVDIDWPRGHILREFTMLLDPPVFMQASPEGTPAKSVAAPQSKSTFDSNAPLNRPGYEAAASNNTQSFAPAPRAAQPAPRAQNNIAVAPQQNTRTLNQPRYQAAANDAYRVQKNDTAWKLAEKLRTDKSVSIEQMMMALLRRNPEAFIKDNINGVKRGYILRMPDQAEIHSIDRQTAVLQVKEQYALWREYSQALVAKRSGNKIDRQAAAAAKVKPSSVDSNAKGRLTIASAAEKQGSTGTTSGSQSPDAKLQQLRQDLAVTSEELESGKLENQELKQRLSALQARMKKMERLLNLKDPDLAQLQSDISPAAADPAMQTAMDAPQTAEIIESQSDAMSDSMSEMAESSDPMMAESEMTEAGMADEMMADGMAANEQPVFKDEVETMTPGMDSSMDDSMASTNDPMPATPAPVLPPVETTELSATDPAAMLEQFMKDPNSLPVIIAIPAAILALILFVIFRRKKAKAAQAAAAVAELPETGDFSFDEVADELTDDISSVDDFNDDEEQKLTDQLDAFAEEAENQPELPADEDVISLDDDEQPEETDAEKDDVLAEADVYLAYGIYQQAEELLKTAVAENPSRNDYKVKLLETYFASKDKAGFAEQANVLKANVDEDSADWQRVVAMGRELDSSNSLYSGTSDLSDFDVDDVLPSKPETDFDLGDAAADFDLGDALDEHEDFDLGLDDESLDDELPATVALSADEAANFDLGDMSADGDDNFALNDAGLDELDQELADVAGESLDLGLPDSDDDELDDSFSLDFEMSDLGLDESDAEISAEETDAIASSLETSDDDLSATLDEDISIDLDTSADDFNHALDDISLNENDTPSEIDSALDADLDMDLDGDISLDMGDIDLASDLDSDLTASLDADDMSLDLGEMDTNDIDLSMDDVDLAADNGVALAADDEEPIDISSLPDDLDEVNTKLDLARAYIDMGDNDGASSILREVIDEAGDTQKAEAEEMLKNIA